MNENSKIVEISLNLAEITFDLSTHAQKICKKRGLGVHKAVHKKI